MDEKYEISWGVGYSDLSGSTTKNAYFCLKKTIQPKGLKYVNYINIFNVCLKVFLSFLPPYYLFTLTFEEIQLICVTQRVIKYLYLLFLSGVLLQYYYSRYLGPPGQLYLGDQSGVLLQYYFSRYLGPPDQLYLGDQSGGPAQYYASKV